MSSRSRLSNKTGVKLSRLGILNDHTGASHAHGGIFSRDTDNRRKTWSLRLLIWKKYFQPVRVSANGKFLLADQQEVSLESLFCSEKSSSHVTVWEAFQDHLSGGWRGQFPCTTPLQTLSVCCNTISYYNPHSTHPSRQNKCLLATETHTTVSSAQAWLCR